MDTANDRLKSLCKTHVDTTMIGALSAVEEALGHLWNYKNPDKSSEEQQFYILYEALRKKILDTGNNQKRKLDEEFDCFDVKLKVYNYNFRVTENCKWGGKTE